MNGFFVVYKTGTGEIAKTLFMPESDVSLNYSPDDGEAYLSGEGYYDADYVIDGSLKARPESTVNLIGFELINVQPGSIIYIDETPYQSKDGGTIELSFNMTGTYTVRVESFPYLDKEFTIDYQP